MIMSFLNELMNLYVPDDFGIDDYDGSLTYSASEYEREVYHIAEKCGITIQTNYGCTQFVIITETRDVYKIPFAGTLYCDYIGDGKSEDVFEIFKIDHSKRAVDLYNEAVDAKVEDFFSEIALVGWSKNNYPIYQQAWACTYFDKKAEPSAESTTKAEKMEAKKYIPFDRDWLALAIDFFGEEKVFALLQFIDDNDIDDLHRNNYGFDDAGLPVIFDYSSYIDSYM